MFTPSARAIVTATKSTFLNKRTYTSSTTSLAYWTVPAGITKIYVKAWGGGGALNPNASDSNVKGGGGGFISGYCSVIPGQIIAIYYGGTATSILRTEDCSGCPGGTCTGNVDLSEGGWGCSVLIDVPSKLIVVGGGGGGYQNGTGVGTGGAGGGQDGQSGSGPGSQAGGGATGSTGGAGGVGGGVGDASSGADFDNTSGGSIKYGGSPGAHPVCGDGGNPELFYADEIFGGYGGGGAASGGGGSQAGGGGGSSISFGFTNVINTQGSGGTPANTSDSDFLGSSYSYGGITSSRTGKPGYIIIRY